jgi:hypothetical protein
MNKRRLILLFAATAACASFSPRVRAQELPPAKRTAHAEITQGPEVAGAKDNWAIIRWTGNNPGGSDEHFAVVHYGTSPDKLTETARSHIRLNQNHSYTVFRVMVNGLKPGTTYYYTVDSLEADGGSDGMRSGVKQFTMPGEPQQASK